MVDIPRQAVIAKADQDLSRLEEWRRSKGDRPLDGTTSRAEIYDRHLRLRAGIERERDHKLTAMASSPLHFARLPVGAFRYVSRFLDAVRDQWASDHGLAPVELSGETGSVSVQDGHDGCLNLAMLYHNQLAATWEGLAEQIAQYRRDRLRHLLPHDPPLPPAPESAPVLLLARL